MNAQEVIKTLRDALSYYAAGNHIQHDTLGVASQPYVEPGHRAADALADTASIDRPERTAPAVNGNGNAVLLSIGRNGAK